MIAEREVRRKCAFCPTIFPGPCEHREPCPSWEEYQQNEKLQKSMEDLWEDDDAAYVDAMRPARGLFNATVVSLIILAGTVMLIRLF